MAGIVFFGSGPVGLASLRALAESFDIEAVITKPYPKSSRAPALVADFAKEQEFNLLQPDSKKSLEDMISAANFKSEIGVIVDYGVIVTQSVIDSFSKGIINSHFSLLPEWRGADPITFSLLSGQAKTGVSIMRIDETLDTGKLLAQVEYAIEPNETIHALTNNLVEISSLTLEVILPKYIKDELVLFDQDTESREPSYSRKLAKSDGKIDWAKPAATIEREIRAFLGWPGSSTVINNKDVIITEARVIDKSGEPGSPFMISKTEFGVYCSQKSLEILALRPSGKKEMSAQAFLAGNKIT